MVTVSSTTGYIEVTWQFNEKTHTIRISKTNGLITYYAINSTTIPLKSGSVVGYIHPRFYDGNKWWFPSLSPSTCNVSITEQTSTKVTIEATTKLRDDPGNEANNSFTMTYTIEDNEPVKVTYLIDSGSSITVIDRILQAFELESTSYIMTADRAIFDPDFTDTSGTHFTQNTREAWITVKTNGAYIGTIIKSPSSSSMLTEQFYRTSDTMFDVNLSLIDLSITTFPVTAEVEIVADTVRYTIHRRYHDIKGANHDWKDYNVTTILKKYKGARNLADSFDYSNFEKQAYVAFHHWLWLYDITGNEKYLNKAKTIADNIIANNYNSSVGIFLSGTIGEDHENGVICMLLLRLYEITGNSNYLTYVKNVLQAFFSNRKTTGELPRRYNNGTWEYMSESSDTAYPNMSSDGIELVGAYYWYKKLTGDNFADSYISDIENYYAQFWDSTLKMFKVGENSTGILNYFSLHQHNSHHIENVYMRLKANATTTYSEIIDALLSYMYRGEDVHAGFYLDYIDEKPYPMFTTLDGRTAPWALNAYDALNVAVWITRLITEGLINDSNDYRKAVKESVWYGVAVTDDNGYIPSSGYTREDEVVTSGTVDWLAPYVGGFLTAQWASDMPIIVEFPNITSVDWDGSTLTIEGDAGNYEIVLIGRRPTSVKLNGNNIEYSFANNTLTFTTNSSGTIEITTTTSQGTPHFTITQYTDSVTVNPGDTFGVEWHVTNDGDAEDTFTIELIDHNGTVVDSHTSATPLNPGGTATSILYGTAPSQPGTYTWKLQVKTSSGTVTDQKNVTVNVVQPSVPHFTITSYTSEVSVEPGGTITVQAVVKNDGDASGMVTARLFDHNNTLMDAKDANIAPNNTTMFTLTATAPSQPGTYTWRLDAYNNDTGNIDDEKTITVNVQAPQPAPSKKTDNTKLLLLIGAGLVLFMLSREKKKR